MEERPANNERPFLQEERALFDAVAERLGGIIERGKEQQALRESEERFRTLVEHAYDGIYIRDAEGRITYANQCFADIHGQPLDDVMGVKAADLLFADDRTSLQQRGS